MHNEHFTSQIDEGATEMFFYAIEREGNLTDDVPLFKEAE